MVKIKVAPNRDICMVKLFLFIQGVKFSFTATHLYFLNKAMSIFAFSNTNLLTINAACIALF